MGTVSYADYMPETRVLVVRLDTARKKHAPRGVTRGPKLPHGRARSRANRMHGCGKWDHEADPDARLAMAGCCARPVVIAREQFSVRMTQSLYSGLPSSGQTASARIRELVRMVLDSAVWPPFVDPSVDEDLDRWVQVRLSQKMRSDLSVYQASVGCRDLSAAIRSLIVSGQVMDASGRSHHED